jgi:hypothetical protein
MPDPTTFCDTRGLAETEVPAAYRGADLYRPFSPLTQQLADTDPYWLRLWISDARLAPGWLPTACPNARGAIAMPGYLGDDDLHYPIWDCCIWSQVRQVCRRLMIGRALRSGPRLQHFFIPGAVWLGSRTLFSVWFLVCDLC